MVGIALQDPRNPNIGYGYFGNSTELALAYFRTNIMHEGYTDGMPDDKASNITFDMLRNPDNSYKAWLDEKIKEISSTTSPYFEDLDCELGGLNWWMFAWGYWERHFEISQETDSMTGPMSMSESIRLAKDSIQTIKQVLEVVKALKEGQITKEQLVENLGNNLSESAIDRVFGDLFYLTGHLDHFTSENVTDAESKELGRRVKGMMWQMEKLGFSLYTAYKTLSAPNSASTKGLGSKAIGNSNEVSFSQRSIDHAFGKHKSDFGNYTDGSKASVNQFTNDVKNLIDTGVQKTGTFRATSGTHIYDPSTSQWAFVNSDGTFNAAFKLSPDQFKYLIETGVVK